MDHTPDAPGPEPLPCQLTLEYTDRVNLAIQQLGTPLVDAIELTNTAESPLEDLSLTATLAGVAMEPWTGRLARIDPGASARISPERWRLSATALASRTEAERTTIDIEARAADRTHRQSFEIDLLPFDQWPGTGHLPEVTAAFITPNHALVAELLRGARRVLGARSDRDAIDGYQSASRQRAALLAEACFLSLTEQRIGYINPPASFEKSGQRIRLVDRIMRERFATCLDLSLLLMGLWEQAGLHALLLLPEGHAMPAFWTHPASLPEAVIDEPARIRNLIELGEIVALESTHATHQGPTFAGAIEAARKNMLSPGSVFCAIDLKACRKRGIRPLPLREGDLPGIDPVALTDAAPLADTTALGSVLLADRADAGAGPGAPTEPPESGNQRIARWQSRLLDLSLRNRLINARDSGRTLPLSVPSIASLEDRLASEERVRILAQTEGDAAFRAEELAAGRIYAACTEAETQKRLLTIYRAALSSIEETGANLLHLALGSLVWYESPTAEAPRRAPLIMLPVRLIRSATGAGYAYTIELSGEPVRPNVTLLEKIHNEFGIDVRGLADLPEDDSGVDVPMILRNFRSAIRDARRWEVEESANLGLFSFNKFLMWRDLKENLAALRTNRMVDHLVERPGTDFDTTPFPAADSLDRDLAPGTPLCTRDADSSQIVAICAAAEGRSFVLEGPPGTGKSQTIANIIADALAGGKRVLFVAEKLAALSVVRKRLEQDGLGPFCLELHSAKASKKEVLEQLRAALDAKAPAPHADWAKHCRDLGQSRQHLNAYVDELHRVRPSGETLYQALATLSDLGPRPSVAVPATSIAEVTQEQLATWRELIAELAERSRPIGTPAEHPLSGIGASLWDFSLPDRARAAIAESQSAHADLSIAAQSWLGSAIPSAQPAQLTQSDLRTLAALAAILSDAPNPPTALISGSSASALRQRLHHAIDLGRQREALRASLTERYQPEFESIDHLSHIAAAKSAMDQIALIRFFRARSIRAKLRAFARTQLPPLLELIADLDKALQTKRLSDELTAMADLGTALGPRWNNARPDWDALQALADWCDRFAKLAMRLHTSPSLLAGVMEIAADERRTQALAPHSKALVASLAAWDKQWALLESVLTTDPLRAFGKPAQDWLATAGRVLARWQSGLGDLNNWCVYNSARLAADAAGLTDLTARHAAGSISSDDLAPAFEAGYAAKWFTAVANSVDTIRTFNAERHESQIERFRSLDKDTITLTRAVVAEKLAAAAPSASVRAASQSEVGILRRELEKKSRHLPTRRLIERMPNLLPRLKPCFLMSPLSVAQFLDPAMPGFDIVIFDEASQIPVWDAVGAIARGKEVIVVGDSKQLPPTSFFRTIDTGEDDSETPDEGVEDMESILKECNASGIPSLRLRWHYRSRHESLIAFSNHHYYQNELMTFPSPVERSEGMGVTFRYTADAVYDRGKSGTNRIEAERVVDEVVRMLQDPADRDSIGIVTFNQPQQTLIQDLLDAKRRELPEIEPYFTSEFQEPVFVKNLENVQGDERDTILFSVGFGPDEAGRVSMNFGPLNQDGGERRLNVAITRARRRLIVFSSLTSDMIDLRRTRVTGVAHFKRFLDYAERGPQALEEASSHTNTASADQRFERALRARLIERGYEVDANVGCAAYRIDLAIRDSDNPGSYLLGIECDGHHYRAASTARDRDRTRPSVLRGLGWNLHRVWSTQWRINPESCLAQIDAVVIRAREAQSKETPEPVEALAPPLIASAPPIAKAPARQPQTLYTAASPGRSRLGQRDLYAPESDDLLSKWLTAIVETEAPILGSLATRRLAAFCDLAAVRDRFRQRFEDILAQLLAKGALRQSGDTLWKPADNPDAYRTARQPGPEPETRRDADQIPPEEYIAAVFLVVQEQFGLPRADLPREAATKLGFTRVTTALIPFIEQAINTAIERGLITDAGDTISLGNTP